MPATRKIRPCPMTFFAHGESYPAAAEYASAAGDAPMQAIWFNGVIDPRKGTVMPFSLADYFQKQGLRVIAAALRAVDAKPASYLRDDDHYRMYVVQPAWSALPVSVRMLM